MKKKQTSWVWKKQKAIIIYRGHDYLHKILDSSDKLLVLMKVWNITGKGINFYKISHKGTDQLQWKKTLSQKKYLQ